MRRVAKATALVLPFAAGWVLLLLVSATLISATSAAANVAGIVLNLLTAFAALATVLGATVEGFGETPQPAVRGHNTAWTAAVLTIPTAFVGFAVAFGLSDWRRGTHNPVHAGVLLPIAITGVAAITVLYIVALARRGPLDRAEPPAPPPAPPLPQLYHNVGELRAALLELPDTMAVRADVTDVPGDVGAGVDGEQFVIRVAVPADWYVKKL
jgi:hypothetical protein